jgi:ABC-2 type transport system permease protein
MSVYVRFGLKSFSNQLAYRSEVWLRLLGNLVTIFIQLAIWKAVIGNGQVAGITLEQMIAYSILNTLTFSLLLNSGVTGKVEGSLKSGSIGTELIKPLSYPLYLLADGLGSSLYQLVFTVIPSFLIAWLLFGMLPPASGAHMAAFGIALLIALLISFLLGYLIALIAFWFLTPFALTWMLGGFLTIFAGGFMPIWFFPAGWAKAAGMLPFQYMGYIPASLYLGHTAKEDIASVLLTGLGWVAALWLIVALLWQRAIKRLVIQGG